jgi:hypothetical protein
MFMKFHVTVAHELEHTAVTVYEKLSERTLNTAWSQTRFDLAYVFAI